MLSELTVRDIVLIEALTIGLAPGLTVLTGETGAGKSILLDALGLALGGRAEARLLRTGAAQASATALFEPPPDHPVWSYLAEQGLASEPGPLLLRRTLSKDGRTRAFLNDEPVSVGLLRGVGDLLVEVQGQFEQRGLLDTATHRTLLDAFAGALDQARRLAELYNSWRTLEGDAAAALAALKEAQREEEWLRHSVSELELLAPQPGEEAELARERALLMNTGKILEALTTAYQALSNKGGAEGSLSLALRELERVADKAAGRLDPLLECLNRALADTAEAAQQLQSLSADTDLDPRRLETVEQRYFALKDMARKHACPVDELPARLASLQQQLAMISSGETTASELLAKARAAESAFRQAARALSDQRHKAAKKLDAAVQRELPPLKLEKARFVTHLEALPEKDWSAQGADQVSFEVATNPGSAPGPLAKIASGGELARFLLALKVVLARLSPVSTLVFDEVDAGIGGATADAVGERLARLATERQVLVITHSPQVAARGHQHWRVAKGQRKDNTTTEIAALTGEQRGEEIARMLAGAEITAEARAAAQKLLDAAS